MFVLFGVQAKWICNKEPPSCLWISRNFVQPSKRLGPLCLEILTRPPSFFCLFGFFFVFFLKVANSLFRYSHDFFLN